MSVNVASDDLDRIAAEETQWPLEGWMGFAGDRAAENGADLHLWPTYYGDPEVFVQLRSVSWGESARRYSCGELPGDVVYDPDESRATLPPGSGFVFERVDFATFIRYRTVDGIAVSVEYADVVPSPP